MARIDSLNNTYIQPSMPAETIVCNGMISLMEASAPQVRASRGMDVFNFMHFHDVHVDPDPSLGTKRPLVVMFHGRDSDKSYVRPWCQHLADRGAIVVNANYTLPITDDAFGVDWSSFHVLRTWEGREALRHARDRIDPSQWGLEYNAIVAMGASLGGTISVLGMIASPDNLGIPRLEERLDAMVGLWTAFPDPTSTRDLTALGAGSLVEDKGYNYFDGTDIPAVCVIHGTADTNPTTPYETGLEIAREAREAGLYVEMYPLVGADHGPWDLWDEMATDFFRFLESLSNRRHAGSQFTGRNGQVKFLD